MKIEKLLMTATALTLVVAATAPAGARNIANNPTPVTFLRSVEMPGTTLPAGEYVFERVNPQSSNVVVLVRSRKGNVQWLGLTHTATRLRAGKTAIELSEARAGEAPRVLTWFPTDSVTGVKFLY